MAPELRSVDTASGSLIDHQLADMWALGRTSFYMLTKTKDSVDDSAIFRYMGNTSPEAGLFIKSLMEPVVDKRLSAKRALEHVWIRPCRTKDVSVPYHLMQIMLQFIDFH